MKYLFDLARVCHVSPLQVDALKYADFLQLILCIDAFYEASAQSLLEE